MTHLGGKLGRAISIAGHIALVTVITFSLFACERSAKPQQTKLDPELQKLGADLPKDPLSAEQELEHRFSRDVTIKDGLITVHDALTGRFDTKIYPTSVQWSLSCGMGFSVTFGPRVTTDTDNATNMGEVLLSMNLLDRKLCDQIAPIFAHRLRHALAQSTPDNDAASQVSAQRMPGETPADYLKRTQ